MSETIHFIIRTYADIMRIYMCGASIAFLAEISAVNVDVSPLEGQELMAPGSSLPHFDCLIFSPSLPLAAVNKMAPLSFSPS